MACYQQAANDWGTAVWLLRWPLAQPAVGPVARFAVGPLARPAVGLLMRPAVRPVARAVVGLLVRPAVRPLARHAHALCRALRVKDSLVGAKASQQHAPGLPGLCTQPHPRHHPTFHTLPCLLCACRVGGCCSPFAFESALDLLEVEAEEGATNLSAGPRTPDDPECSMSTSGVGLALKASKGTWLEAGGQACWARPASPRSRQSQVPFSPHALQFQTPRIPRARRGRMPVGPARPSVP
eukprot:10505-Chlamydomonas_euryale.AAC.3